MAEFGRELDPTMISRSAFRSARTFASRKGVPNANYMSTLARDGPPVTETNREHTQARYNFMLSCCVGAQTSMRRFWKIAHVQPGEGVFASYIDATSHLILTTGFIEVALDGRSLKTPEGNKLRLPPQKKLFAALVANEWDVQDKLLKPHTLPLVRRFKWLAYLY